MCIQRQASTITTTTCSVPSQCLGSLVVYVATKGLATVQTSSKLIHTTVNIFLCLVLLYRKQFKSMWNMCGMG